MRRHAAWSIVVLLAALNMGVAPEKAPDADFSYYASDVTQDRVKVEWVVRAPEGGTVHRSTPTPPSRPTS